ncbi:catechol 1,2-dioxygenase [Novosphingobium sp. SG751A]|uniref:dioxygenase family protein n=1 Tax=Novosphingobium sp. SG751A TaxID=2587000 RepID=UPI001557EE7E|nr:dioxygenase [Novosphingobium sp. SG751A]NOW48890.1 catechol 1,2-dioxygenase [Novosphingobium sp. SG751A]
MSGASLEDQVASSLAACPNPRLAHVITRMVSHLHQAIREVQLTQEEWEEGIRFLTDTGKKCDASRQEFILLSDVLGASMLVDQINHSGDDGSTQTTVFGPFYDGLQRVIPHGGTILLRPEPGVDPLMVQGKILDTAGQPIRNALIEVWQTAPNGLYDVQDPQQPRGHLRASLNSRDDGSYAFETVMPVCYPIPMDGPVGGLLRALGRSPWRPAHIHFMITAPGHRRLVTHLFLADDPHLQSDAVFGVKDALIRNADMQSDGKRLMLADFYLG